jgi:hypothetical protein
VEQFLTEFDTDGDRDTSSSGNARKVFGLDLPGA